MTHLGGWIEALYYVCCVEAVHPLVKEPWGKHQQMKPADAFLAGRPITLDTRQRIAGTCRKVAGCDGMLILYI